MCVKQKEEALGGQSSAYIKNDEYANWKKYKHENCVMHY